MLRQKPLLESKETVAAVVIAVVVARRHMKLQTLMSKILRKE